MMNISMSEQESLMKPRIVVFGVGGAGSNAINNMIRSGLEGTEFVAANTDAQALTNNLASRKLQLGVTVTRGLGAGARPDVGRESAEEQMDEIGSILEGAHMVFITAGMGGGTGTGAAPVIARAARERGILTVGVVTKPFHFEGAVRMRSAEAGIDALQQYVDTLIVIPNQQLFNIANEKTGWSEAFKLADDVLYQGVRGVTDLIMTPGQINLDFADIRSVMSEMGKAMMGSGEAEGENRARRAAEMAINNPLLEDASVKGARGVLINITGGPDLTLFEVEEAADLIREEVDPDANIIFGTAMDDSMQGKIRISVVATGIDLASQRKRPPLSVVGSESASQVAQSQSAYMPSATPSAPQAPAQSLQSRVMGGLFAPASSQQASAQVQSQPAQGGRTATTASSTVAPVTSLSGMGNFYSGMTAEAVGNTLRAPEPEEVSAARVIQPAFSAAPVRGVRQGEQFVAPVPVQAPRQQAPAQTSQVPLQGLMPLEAPTTARKPGFGERMLGKVKKLVSQLEADEPHAPAAAPQAPVAQPRAGYEVSHGGARAGLPPVADSEIDIPSFLRRQAN